MEKRHALSEEQFAYLIELWNKYHNTVHIRTIELTEEEAAFYEGTAGARDDAQPIARAESKKR